MTQSNHKLFLNKSISSEMAVRSNELVKSIDGLSVRLPESVIRASELLRCFGIPAKNFAYDLKVSERYVQLMANGEKPIQAWMINQIISIGEELLWKQKEAIEAYIQKALKSQYGRSE